MSTAHLSSSVDRHAEIGALGQMARKAIRRLIIPIVGLVLVEVLHLTGVGSPGASAFAFIGFGTCLALGIWCSRATGLPLVPLMAVQNLIIYGIPIVTNHETITTYSPLFVFNAGLEVLSFDLAMAVSWWMAMQVFSPSRPVCHALREYKKTGSKGMTQLGFGMVIGSTAFLALQSQNLLGAFYLFLPNGADSILNTLLSVMNACGVFLISMEVGSGEASLVQKTVFYASLVINTMISADGFLLAAAAANLITAAIGFFWGSGRIPWRYLTVTMALLSFLNIGKTTMRSRYWGNDDRSAVEITTVQLPSLYMEWAEASYNGLLDNNVTPVSANDQGLALTNKNQTLLDRIDNLQNMLFVIDAVQAGHIDTLHGASYSLIPPLLIPRVLWPNKPRSHEGQVMLNVHFGRQDLASTFTTYIAWGLLPEAYGNFGPIEGTVLLGIFLGVFFAWIEKASARKLIVSTEGFLCLCMLLSLVNSFEMVASVFVTATFQSMIVIVVASYPFVQRTVITRSDPEPAATSN